MANQAHLTFKELVQARWSELKGNQINPQSDNFPCGYDAGVQDLLDIIHNHGYVILDNAGRRVNPPDMSMACGIWHKESKDA